MYIFFYLINNICSMKNNKYQRGIKIYYSRGIKGWSKDFREMDGWMDINVVYLLKT